MGKPHGLFVGTLVAIGGFVVMAVLVGPMNAQRAGTPELELGADGFPIAKDAVVPPDLPSEIQRWRQQLVDTGKVLKVERNAIEAEHRSLDRLRERIQGRRRQHREHGFSQAARADDQRDVMNYTHRLRALRERTTAYEARVTAFRQAASEYTAHLQHSGLTSAGREP